MTEDRNIRNGRPSKEYLATLQPMSRKGYRRLELACMQAILTDKKYITMVTSYLTKFDEDFPRATAEKVDGTIVTRRVNARQCMQWLFDKGYTHITLEDLRVAKMKFTKGEYDVEGL